MELKKIHWIGIIVGFIIVLLSLFFLNTKAFFLIMGLGLIAAALPFAFTAIRESQISNEKEEMFLEFARSLVESVKTGTPISKSIINVKNKSFGVLSPHINKLANQISMGIPLNSALQTFSKDADNKTISRALTLIGQAEKAGGDIGEILQAVAGAVTMSDKLKKERRATISTLIAQGYIIFLIFMVIVLIMQFKIIPMVSGIAGLGTEGVMGSGAGELDQTAISNSFFFLLVIQGLFSGLVIGKLAEGNIKAGIKHSISLVIFAFLVSAGARLFL